MPLGLPAPGTLRTPENFEAPLKSFVDLLEQAVQELLVTAREAKALAAAAYKLPEGGIPDSALTNAGLSVRSVAYDVAGSKWPVRPTSNPAVLVIWVKSDAAYPDPPIDGTYFREGRDTIFKP